MKPTEKQFRDYVRIQKSGVTNMFNIPKVCALSNTGLTEEICFYIMDNYSELRKEYNV